VGEADKPSKPSKEDYQARLDKISSIFSDMVKHADAVSLTRCPYKDRHSHCTAKFGCRFQKRGDAGDSIVCQSDDKLDYRTAWEMDPKSKDEMHDILRSNRDD